MDTPLTQIAAAVTSANGINLGSAPALALAQLYASTSHALGLQAINQASSQQHAAITQNAVTVTVCSRILDLVPASVAKTT